jgi:hypothetical protein
MAIARLADPGFFVDRTARGMLPRSLHRQALLDPHFVLPPVTEIVFVQKSFVGVELEVAEANLARLRGEAQATD